MPDRPDFSKFVNWPPPGWGVSEGVHIEYDSRPHRDPGYKPVLTDWSGAEAVCEQGQLTEAAT